MADRPVWSGRVVEWAKRFHVEYEYQAKRFGWDSQTPVDFDELPEANRQTMMCTVALVMGSEVYGRERHIETLTTQLAQVTRERDEARAVIEAVLTIIEERCAILSRDTPEGEQ